MNDYQLSKEALGFLRKRHKAERKKVFADRLKAVYLLGSGWPVADVCEALLVDENTVYRYFDAYKKHGIRALMSDNYKGKEQKLTMQELKLFEQHLQECPSRTTKQAIDFIQNEFSINYSVSGMNALLKRMGYTYRKPQPIPGKLDRDEQAKFIKKYRKIRRNMTVDDSLFFMDGVHPHHNPTIQKGWFKKGKEVLVKTGTRFNCLNINAAVDIDNLDVISTNTGRLTEETTLDFLIKLRARRSKGYIYLVLDNAGYYNTERIRSAAKKLAIKLIYLPPYSPNLNLIERLWNYMRTNFLYNSYFETFKEFKSECMRFMKNLRYKKRSLRSLLTENFQTFA